MLTFTRYFGSGDNWWTADVAWRPVSLRNPLVKWLLSSQGTDVYYLVGAADDEPPLLNMPTSPESLQLFGNPVERNDVGPLAPGQWRFANQDSLPRSTVYYRHEDGIDPDTLPIDSLQLFSVPTSQDVVCFARNSGSVTGGYDTILQTPRFICEPGYSGQIGAEGNYLIIRSEDVMLDGQGTLYLAFYPIGTLNPLVRIGTQQQAGGPTVYLRNDHPGMEVRIHNGRLVLPGYAAESSTLANLVAEGQATIELGTGCQCLGNIILRRAQAELQCIMSASSARLDIYSGSVELKDPFKADGSGAQVNVYGGECRVSTSRRITRIRTQQAGLEQPVLSVQNAYAADIGDIEYAGGQVRLIAGRAPVPVISVPADRSYEVTLDIM